MTRGLALKDAIRESYLFRARAIVAGGIAALLMLLLAGRLFYLQIIKHDHFTTLSQQNRVSIVPLPPTRGLIYDRNGIVLAENLPTFSLEMTPEKVPDLKATIKKIRSLIQVTEDDLARFNSERRRHHLFEEVPLRFKLTDEEVSILAVNRHLLQGVEIRSRMSRYYPWASHTSHVVGYVGRISENEMKRLDLSSYSGSTHIGKVGIERTYEKELHGIVGFQQVETNAGGRALRVLERQPPVPGKNLSLSIDLRLQMIAEKAFGNERGALVAIDPKTGAVLALVSVPGYDPNLFVNGIGAADYKELSTSADRPLFNRALRGQYPPGSTIKPGVGLAGLETGHVKPWDRVTCRGYYTLPGDRHRYRDWKKVGHGPVVLHDAIVESCDVYFYGLAQSMGIDPLAHYLRQLGFGERTGIDVVGEAQGLLPTTEWKRRVHGQPWWPGETLIAGIGQGFFLATPLQLASYVATLATHGHRMQPQVVAAMTDPSTGRRITVEPKPLTPVPIVKEDNWTRVVKAMTDVVHGAHGTARRISRNVKYRIAGKTGTAQVFGIKQNEKYEGDKLAKKLRDHALFVSFAPVDDPRIAVGLIVENGEHGSSSAAPIARRVMDAYLLDEPLPPELLQVKNANAVNKPTLVYPTLATPAAPEPAPAAPPARVVKKPTPREVSTRAARKPRPAPATTLPAADDKVPAPPEATTSAPAPILPTPALPDPAADADLAPASDTAEGGTTGAPAEPPTNGDLAAPTTVPVSPSESEGPGDLTATPVLPATPEELPVPPLSPELPEELPEELGAEPLPPDFTEDPNVTPADPSAVLEAFTAPRSGKEREE